MISFAEISQVKQTQEAVFVASEWFGMRWCRVAQSLGCAWPGSLMCGPSSLPLRVALAPFPRQPWPFLMLSPLSLPRLRFPAHSIVSLAALTWVVTNLLYKLIGHLLATTGMQMLLTA